MFWVFFTSEHILVHAVVKGEISGPEQRLFTGVALSGTFKGPPAKQEVSYVTFIPLTGHGRTLSETLVPPLSCTCVWRSAGFRLGPVSGRVQMFWG